MNIFAEKLHGKKLKMGTLTRKQLLKLKVLEFKKFVNIIFKSVERGNTFTAIKNYI